MRTLPNVRPTPEQLALFSNTKPGVEIIRGAAGSGKTTTALLKLRAVIGAYLSRKKRSSSSAPVRILVLTYNRTLKGYIEELARHQVAPSPEVEIDIQTFASWSLKALGCPALLQNEDREQKLHSLGKHIGLPLDFLCEEIEYCTGRFVPKSISEYINARRDGRGLAPRVEKATREAIIEKVIRPYQEWKTKHGLRDWNDLAIDLIENQIFAYDIVVADETQDFSANQIRAIMNQLAADHSVTFVLDTAQRIYARGFTWQEVGITIRPENSHRLTQNYRNTVQIARLAASVISNVAIDDDATFPDFSASTREGEIPLILNGKFGKQLEHMLSSIISKIDLTKESVAFLHPKGGKWFDHTRSQLKNSGLPFIEITRNPEWPQGTENIALSTIHSAKGLEFDHVVMLGLNAEVLPHGEETEDDKLCMLRRLIAMGIGRARVSVTLGYKPDDRSAIIDFFDRETYKEIKV